MALAFVPSSLIVAATSVLTTDVAPIPLLWVLPLGLYLLSFILAFSGGKGARAVYEVAVWLLPFALMLVLVVTVFEVRHPLWLIIGAHLLAVFLVAMVCHGRLAQDRPAARRLTTFYLVEASGGVLGGAFAALVAPLVFDSYLEYPLALAFAAALWPGFARLPWKRPKLGLEDVFWPITLGIALYVALTEFSDTDFDEHLVVYGGVVICLVFATRQPVRLALGVAALYIGATVGLAAGGSDVLVRERNFFGVRTVEQPSPTTRSLVHGTTLHGNQVRAAGSAPADDLLPPRQPDRPARLRCAAGDDGAHGGDRPRDGHDGGPQPARRALDVLRDRPGDRPRGLGPALLHLPP